MITTNNTTISFRKSALHIALICVMAIGPLHFAKAQVIDISSGHSPISLAETITGNGVQILNPVITCADSAIGKYGMSGVPDFPDGKGIVLSTGNIYDMHGPNDSQTTTTSWGTPGDEIIKKITGYPNFDACILEFDVVPVGDTLRFDFTFASEEYHEYVGTPFNDVFGFFISGPGISGDPGLGGLENIALIPGTNQYVGINTVNQGNPDIGFPAMNQQYFVDNPLNPNAAVQYDGWTRNLYAQKVVNPCDTFHLKMIIADVADDKWDSSVFIEKIESNNITVEGTTVGGTQEMIEGCNEGTITFTREPVTGQDLLVTYYLGGTAINGTDYPLIGTDPDPQTPKFITILANEPSASINIMPYADGIDEGIETLQVFVGNPYCSGTVQDSLTLIIRDSLEVSIDPLSFVCLGDSLELNVESDGTSYSWSPADFLNDTEIKNPTTTPTSNITYTVSASLAACTSVTTTDIIVSDVQLTAIPTHIVCGGADNGAIDLTIAGGLTPYTVQWSGPSGFTSTDKDIDNLTPGLYIAHITDREGCTDNISITITEIESMEINLSSPIFVGDENVSCYESSDGQITATITNGTPPYSFEWDDAANQTTQIATNLGVGTYTVSVTDANLCVQTANITLTAPAPVTGSLVSKENVLCNGVNSGTATVEGNGGTPGYTYLWNTLPPQIGPTGSSLLAGIYNVTITDVNGCTGNIEVEINQPASSLSGTVTTTNVLCYGESTGSASANIMGGTPPYSYTWSADPGNDTADISDLPIGNYSLTVTDSNGCDYVVPFNITQPPALDIQSVSHTDVACHGDNTGATTVSATGGKSPYTYSWNTTPEQTDNSASGLEAGFYTVTTTDANGCTADLEIEITQPEVLEIELIDLSHPTCNGDTDGSIEVNATGGASPYTYTWNTLPPTTGNTVTGLAEGTHEVTVEDANGCTLVESIELIAPNPIDIAVSNIEHVLCNGEATGSATLSVTGGTPDYTYAWNDPLNQTTQTATNLTAGNYSVVVTDENGCTASLNISINEPDFPLQATVSASDDAICFGDNTGSATVSVTGGSGSYSYSWNDDANQQTPTASNLAAGIYTVTITDNNGCATPLFFDLTINGPTTPIDLTLTPSLFPGGANVMCATDSTATIDLGITGGTAPYTILWELPGIETSTDQDLINLAPGTYTVTVTDDNGCEATETIAITAPQPIEISYTSTPSLCFGLPSGSIELTIEGGVPGYDVLWNGPSGFTGTDLSLDDLEGGVYYITITDASGCVYEDAATVVQPDDLVITLDSLSDYNGYNLSCYNSYDGEIYITPSGGTAPYSYQWNTPGNPNFSNQQDLINQGGGTYEAVLFDANGCVQNKFIDLIAPDTVKIDFITSLYPNGFNISCAGADDGTIETVPSGGPGVFSFTWIGPFGYGPVHDNPIENLGPGSYSVMATDENGCFGFNTIKLTAPGKFSIELEATEINGNNISCEGGDDGSINLVVKGGEAPMSINWTGPNGFTSTDEDLFNLPAGEYCVSVLDDNDCELTECITLIQPASLSIVLDPVVYANGQNLTCDDTTDGEIQATVTGGAPNYSITWTGPNNFSSNSLNPTGLSEGTYCLEITDASGCTESQCVNLTSPDAIEIVADNLVNPDCGSTSTGTIDITVTGGDAAYAFDWTGPNGFVSTDKDIAGLEEGVYCIEVTDGNNCTSQKCFTITSPSPVAITLSTSTFEGGFEIDCNGNENGSITSSVSGGTGPYTYVWTGPSAFTSNTENLSDLTPGQYCLEITDSNGCESQECVDINEPDVLQLNTAITLPNCDDGALATIDPDVSGGTAPYSYNWSNGTQTPTVEVENGNYTVIITDANNCSVTDNFTIVLPESIVIVPTPSTSSAGYNLTCHDGSDGEISLGIFGGSGNFTASWTGPNGYTSADIDITGLEAGEYCVSITDDQGCEGDICITLTQPEALSITTEVENPTCIDSFDGALSVNILGGVPTYSIAWTGPNGFTGTGAALGGLEAGQYCLTATDFNGCTYQECIDLIPPAPVDISLSSPETNGYNIECYGGHSGQITPTISGGTGDYTYQWAGPNGYTSNDESLVNLYAGIYCLTVTDANNCSDEVCITLTQGPAMDITLDAFEFPTGYNISCHGVCDGALDATIAGGAAPVSVSWTGPNGFTSSQLALSNLCAGAYTLNLVDANGCSQDTSLVITQPAKINIDIESPTFAGGNNIPCHGESVGTIITELSGGIGNLSVAWTGPNGFTSTQADLEDLPAGTYEITVTDENNCTAESSITLTEPAEELTATATSFEFNSGTNISCKGADDGSITSATTGGTTPYVYNWNGPDGYTSDQQDITDLAPGAYTVVVEDANSCVFTINVNLTEPADSLFAEAEVVSQIQCAGDSTGTIEVSATGGSENYTVSWSGPNGFASSDMTISALSAGEYIYELEDENGCEVSGVVTISEPDPIEVTAQVIDADCETPTGIINIAVTNGTPPYTYLWTDNSTNQSLVNVIAGSYSVVITDDNGCTVSETFEIGSFNSLEIEATLSHPACNGDDTGMITAYAVAGQEPITYAWTGPNGFTTSGESIFDLVAGTYTVIVQDNKGCEVIESYDLTQPDPLVIAPLESPVFSTGFNLSKFQSGDGIINAPEVNGGTKSYAYQWTADNGYTSTSGNHQFNLMAGDYMLVVIDANMCTDTVYTTLTEPIPLEMPNGISPNGDGINDYFTVRGLEDYPNNRLLVFNRWGNQVFEEKNYRNSDPWYGTNKHGDQLPEGTYYVVVELQGSDNLKGYLEIRR